VGYVLRLGHRLKRLGHYLWRGTKPVYPATGSAEYLTVPHTSAFIAHSGTRSYTAAVGATLFTAQHAATSYYSCSKTVAFIAKPEPVFRAAAMTSAFACQVPIVPYSSAAVRSTFGATAAGATFASQPTVTAYEVVQ
jgi:hypothetical protein